MFKSGADGDRTRDLLHAMQARSQLRHSPNSLIFHKLLKTFVTIILAELNINSAVKFHLSFIVNTNSNF